MNVAYHLKKLGHQPALLTRTGRDDWSEKLLALFREKDLSTEFFQTDPGHSTGLVYAFPNDQGDVRYDIVKPAAWDFIQWQESFTGLLKEAPLFLFGSLGSRSPESRKTLYRLLEIPSTRVFDVNLRPPHYERAHLEHLLKRTNILKLNEQELQLVSGWYGSGSTLKEKIRVLEGVYPFDVVIVTLGSRGAVVSFGGSVCEHPGYRVQVADTIGSGDAFLAGFVHHLLKGSSCETAIAFSCAQGAFVASRPGACPDYHSNQVVQLMRSPGNQPNLSGGK